MTSSPGSVGEITRLLLSKNVYLDDGVKITPLLCQFIATGTEAVKPQSKRAAAPSATTTSAGALVTTA